MSQVLPLQNKEGVLAMLKVGDKKCLCTFNMGPLNFSYALAVGGGGQKVSIHLEGRGGTNILPCLEVGGTNSFGPAIFPFSSSLPFPVVNDRSLTKGVYILQELHAYLHTVFIVSLWVL